MLYASVVGRLYFYSVMLRGEVRGGGLGVTADVKGTSVPQNQFGDAP